MRTKYRGGASRMVRLGLCLIVAGLIGAGIAAASIPDSGGVIHSCYDSSGAFHLIDPSGAGQLPTACLAGQTALNFNQSGPAGPNGAAGPPGAPGAPGATGAGGQAAVYETGQTGDVAQDFHSVTFAPRIIHLPLPEGSYAVTARALMVGDGYRQVKCVLLSYTAGGRLGTPIDAGFAVLGSDSVGRTGTVGYSTTYIPLQSTMTLSAPGGVSLTCGVNSTPGGRVVDVSGMRIMAISVGSASVYTPSGLIASGLANSVPHILPTVHLPSGLTKRNPTHH